MTRERKIALLILSATLVVGILLGLLIPAFIHKYRRRGEFRQHSLRQESHRNGGSKSEWFANTIHEIVRPDSSQALQIRSITTWAAEEIEALEVSSNSRMSNILDSVKLQLQPILTEEQQARLIEFQEKTHGHWKKGDRSKR